MRTTLALSKLLAIVSLAFCIVFFYSCRKIDKESAELNNPDKLEQEFFKVPDNISPQLQEVIDDIKRQNDRHHFLNEFIRKNGLPVWNKVVSNQAIYTTAQKNVIGGQRLTESNDSTEIYFIPLRYTDGSVRTYIACVKDSGIYKYDVYRRYHLTSLPISPDSNVAKFRESMIAVFGFFEKSINQKDSIQLAYQYQTDISNVIISFSESSGSRVNNDFYSNKTESYNVSIITICYCVGGAQMRRDAGFQLNVATAINRVTVGGCFCENVFVYGSSNGGSGNTGIIGGSGNPGGGGGGGGSTPPPNYNCPPAEWWCESGEYRFINGVLYTSEAYPGKETGFPWAWWETGNYLTANLPLVFFNVENLGLNLTQAVYLINNSTVNSAITDFVTENGNSDETIAAAKIAIDVSKAGVLNDPNNSLHYSIASNYLPPCCPTGPILGTQYIGHIAGRMAVLKYQGDCNYFITCYAMAVREVIQTGLDVIGLIPVVGEIADVTNGVIYTISGDLTNASLSFAATIPVAGWAATGTKWAQKVIKLTPASKGIKLEWFKVVTNTGATYFSFGKRSDAQFRRLLGLVTGDGKQAHHIIPWDLELNEVVQMAAQAKFPFHMQDILNGVGLNAAQHMGSHPAYTTRVTNALEEIRNSLGSNFNPSTAYNAMVELTNRIKAAVAANPNTPINQLIF